MRRLKTRAPAQSHAAGITSRTSQHELKTHSSNGKRSSEASTSKAAQPCPAAHFIQPPRHIRAPLPEPCGTPMPTGSFSKYMQGARRHHQQTLTCASADILTFERERESMVADLPDCRSADGGTLLSHPVFDFEEQNAGVLFTAPLVLVPRAVRCTRTEGSPESKSASRTRRREKG